MAIYRVTAFGHLQGGEEWNCTWHCSGVTNQAATVNALGSDAWTLIWQGPPTPASSIQQLIANEVGVDGVRTEELDDTGRNVNQIIASLALVGTDAAESLPPHVSAAVSLRSLSPTRFGRGRFFLPPFGVDTVLNQRMTAAARGQTAAAAVAGLNHMKAGAFPVVIFHRNNGGFEQVTAIDVGDVFDVQSRRRNQLVETRTRINLT